MGLNPVLSSAAVSSVFLAQQEPQLENTPSVKTSNPINIGKAYVSNVEIAKTVRQHDLSSQPMSSSSEQAYLSSLSLELPFEMDSSESESGDLPIDQPQGLLSAFAQELQISTESNSQPADVAPRRKSLLTAQLSLSSRASKSRQSMEIPRLSTVFSLGSSQSSDPVKRMQKLPDILFIRPDESGALKLDPALRQRQESDWSQQLNSIQDKLNLSDVDAGIVGEILTDGFFAEIVAGREDQQLKLFDVMDNAVQNFVGLTSDLPAQDLGRLLLKMINAKIQNT